MVEDKEVQHYAMHVDPAKKEVSCWIASEAGKVRELLLRTLFSYHWMIILSPTNIGVFGRLVRPRCRIPNCRHAIS